MKECCKVCRYRRGESCRYNPPVLHSINSYWNWPPVKDTDWCGKFLQKHNGKSAKPHTIE